MASIRMPKMYKNLNIFVEGTGYAGVATKVKLPAISTKTEDHRGAGMEFSRKMNMGLEDLEMSFTMMEYNETVNGLVGKLNGSNTQITFRGTLSDDESTATTAVLVNVRGSISKKETGDIEAGGKVETDYTINVKFYEEKVGGKEIFYIDNDNYIHRIEGTDILANQRSDLGL